MDASKLHDIGVEKANAMSKYRRVNRITTLFRIAEAFVFLIVVSRFMTTNFAFSNFSTEYFRGLISTVYLISARSVFVIGNAIVVALLLISGRVSGKTGEKSTDLYDEYVERCRNINNQQTWSKEEIRGSEEKVLSRTHSANLERAVHVRALRRSMSEQCRKSGKKAAPAGGGVGEEMSSEQFRLTVEAFIARQKCLREKEDA